MTISRCRRSAGNKAFVVATAIVLWCSAVGAQTISERGFLEGRGFLFRDPAANDATRETADALFREEVFLRPTRWFQFAAGLDLRASSYDQVEHTWRLDLEDRRVLRPRASVRRLTATVTAGGVTVEVGKQFVRWARTDILNPTDRFAPRDFLNVTDPEFLPVIGARASLQVGPETFEAVWVPQLTPSRMPLLTQRWTVLPGQAAGVSIGDAGFRFPRRAQSGARWRHTGSRLEAGFSYFDGFNHFPGIEVSALDDSGAAVALTRVFPRLRTYGAEMAIPTGWFTLKGEAAWFMSPHDIFAEYGLYVVEMERQIGEWLLIGGYVGEVITRSGTPLAFDPERALAGSILGRATYTADPRRSVTVEVVARQSGDGYYVKGEYSLAVGQHWRVTHGGVVLGGKEDDFLGQFNRNSHFSTALRLSF